MGRELRVNTKIGELEKICVGLDNESHVCTRPQELYIS